MTPKRYALLAILLLLCVAPTSAQKQGKMAKLFLDSPLELIPALSQDLKLELVEQYYAGSPTDEIRNVYGGASRITRLTDTYLQLQLDSTMVVELKLLKSFLRPQYVGLGVTSTLDPAMSVLTFYDKEWHQLDPSTLIDLPGVSSFLKNPGDSARLDLKKALVERGSWDYTATFGAETPTLTFRITTFDEEAAAKLHPTVPALLRDEVTYRWRNNRFVPKS